MKAKMRFMTIATNLLVLGLQSSLAMAAEATKGYNTKIPEQIMTPATVESPFGDLKFEDGMPSHETVAMIYDRLDLMRGVETFLNGIPAASVEGLRLGWVELGGKSAQDVFITMDLLDSTPLFLTGNTDTVYVQTFLDLEKDGPTVVEIPEGCGPGTVNDAFFRFVTDMGFPGPDAGKGGKYLILPPGYEGEVPEGYFVSESPTYCNWLILRGFLVDGKTDAAVRMFTEGLKVYALKDAGNPPAMRFANMSKKAVNTVHANNFDFYKELNTVIQREPIEMIEPQLRGLFASIGIQKGNEFAPDERMTRILTQAVTIGNAAARAIAFRPRDPDAYYYEGRYWYTGFLGGSYEWLKDEGRGGRNLDARTLFFYLATVNTPAMVKKMVGKGSQYAANCRDRDGKYLDGGKTYTLNIPANAPAKDFWSVVVYDPQTRSELQTGQPFPSKNNKRDNLIVNADGSVNLYFGPKPPADKENNWIETVPGKNWFCLLRLYGPLEPWFDKSWRLGDIELMK